MSAPRMGTAPPAVDEVLRSPGRMLDTGTLDFMEPRFGNDFSGVTIHTDSAAARSAAAVNARAYTVGSHVVFGQGHYAPGTADGQRLIAHELTHVVQQQGQIGAVMRAPLQVGESNSAAEQEADRVALQVVSGASGPVAASVGQSTVMRQETTSAQPQQQQRTVGCSQDNADAIEAARRAAAIRCQQAGFQTKGIVPPGPGGGSQDRAHRRARRIARTVFGEDLNMEQVGDIVSGMGARLVSPSLSFVCAPAGDQHCGGRDAYVVNFRSPVHLCPGFFNGTTEEQTRTLIHEAAHLSRIGEALGESYCGILDCAASCGGFDVADSWLHYVHCVTGQTPDTPDVIEGQAGGGAP